MKIQKIKLSNIGPYVNTNEFDFNVSDISKRMVLIGGKNGAGKIEIEFFDADDLQKLAKLFSED